MEVNFIFYFDKEDDGKNLLVELEKNGFKLDQFDKLDLDVGGQWSLHVTKDIKSEEELDELDNPKGMLEKLASKFNVEYDGYDRPTVNF